MWDKRGRNPICEKHAGLTLSLTCDEVSLIKKCGQNLADLKTLNWAH